MRYSITRHGEKRFYTARFMVSYADCPHLCTKQQMEYYRGMAFEHGDTSGLVRSMQFGEFKSSDDDTRLFFEHDMEALRAAMARKPGEATRGTLRAGIDLSSTGDNDPKIVYIADGNQVLPAFTFRIEDCNDAAEAIVKVLREHNVDPRNATFDAGGSGKPIVDYIENRLGYRPVVRYAINQSPRYREEYFDRATEDHFRFKRVLHTQKVYIPNDKALYDQCRTRRIKAMEHDKIKMEPKTEHRKRLRESPDKLDAIVMLFSLIPETSTALQRAEVERQERGDEPWKQHRPELSCLGPPNTARFSGLRGDGAGSRFGGLRAASSATR